MRHLGLSAVVLALLVLIPGDAIAQTAPYIRSFASSPFVYPGQQFRLYIEADNHNLDGHQTDYLIFEFTDPGVFEYVAESASVPDTNDFFEGTTTLDSVPDPVVGFGTLGLRFIYEGNGVTNKKGYVAQYDYIVPIDLTGSYSFTLDPGSTTMNGSDGASQEAAVLSESITVAGFGDASLDGHVNVADLKILASHWMQSGLNASTSWLSGDFTFDGIVNVDDLGVLATHWSDGAASALPLFQAIDPNFTSQPVPEPVTLSLLAVSALLLRRAR